MFRILYLFGDDLVWKSLYFEVIDETKSKRDEMTRAWESRDENLSLLTSLTRSLDIKAPAVGFIAAHLLAMPIPQAQEPHEEHTWESLGEF